MISPQPSLGSDTCGDHTAGKPSIGLPDYYWLVETNTNVAARCYPGKEFACPTTFVGPLNMGASFNRSSWRLKGGVLGTEMRAFHNIAWHRSNTQNKIGLTGLCALPRPLNLRITASLPQTCLACWPRGRRIAPRVRSGPNINLVRDPRFGRASELPGEDPYLNGHYAVHMVSGMQEADAAGHPKMLACTPHAAPTLLEPQPWPNPHHPHPTSPHLNPTPNPNPNPICCRLSTPSVRVPPPQT
jgi:beta-D-xylosidase 4